MGIPNPFKEAEKAINKAKDEINKLANSAKGEITKTGDWSKKVVYDTSVWGRGKVNEVKDAAVKEVTSAASTAKSEIESTAKTAVETALKEAVKAITSESLQKAVDLVQVAAPDSISVTIGPISMGIDSIKEKIDILQSYAKNPPNSKSELKTMIEKFSPESVSLSVSAELAFLVVSSDSLSAGFSATWTKDGFLAKFDDLLKEF